MVIYASQITVCMLHQFSCHVERFSQHIFWDPSGVPDIHVHPPRRGNNQVWSGFLGFTAAAWLGNPWIKHGDGKSMEVPKKHRSFDGIRSTNGVPRLLEGICNHFIVIYDPCNHVPWYFQVHKNEIVWRSTGHRWYVWFASRIVPVILQALHMHQGLTFTELISWGPYCRTPTGYPSLGNKILWVRKLLPEGGFPVLCRFVFFLAGI